MNAVTFDWYFEPSGAPIANIAFFRCSPLCASATNDGHVTEAPSRTALKSRRRITSPKVQDHASNGSQCGNYSRDRLPVEWGSAVILQSNKFRDQMSA
jgi:hypothetical protein